MVDFQNNYNIFQGIPPSLRGEVWLKMAGFDEESEVFKSYSDLTQKVGTRFE